MNRLAIRAEWASMHGTIAHRLGDLNVAGPGADVAYAAGIVMEICNAYRKR